MATPTPYHNLDRFEQDELNWDHTDTVDRVDEEVPKSGTLANRPADPPVGRRYYATDARVLSQYDPDHAFSDASGWFPIAGLGTSTDRVPSTAYLTSLDVETDITVGGTINGVDAAELDGSAGTDGQVLQTDGAAASWSDIDTGAFDGTTETLSVTGWQVIDVGNHGFTGDQTGGDLAQFIADQTAAGGDYVFVLPNGTYDYNRSLQFTGDAGGTYDEDRPRSIAIIGKPEATLHVDIGATVDFSDRICFEFGNSTTGVERVMLKNLHFDIGSHNGDRDAGIMQCYIEDYGYFEDISLTGRRRWAVGATGLDSEKNGHRHTFKLDCINDAAYAEVVDVRLPNGDIYESGAESAGHAIPFASEDYHEGKTVWRGCYVEGFIDNGYYLRDGHGANHIYDSAAVDNGAGNFRLGRNDYAQNITSKATGTQDINCTPLWVEEFRDTDPYDVGSEDDSPLVVDGFELIATGEPVNDVVRCIRNPPETVLRNGYIRCGTDDFVIDAGHDTGKLTVENVSVDDSATGGTREASFRFNADNIDVRNMTYRHAPSGTSNGRSIFRLDGSRITIADSSFLGSYLPALEVYAGADFTVTNCKWPHDGSTTDPYFIRVNTTPVTRMAFRDSDVSDYTGGFVGTGSLSDFDSYYIEDNEGVQDGDVLASGTATLSSGAAVVDTGQASPRVDVFLDPSGGGANASDVKVSWRAFFDSAAGTVKVEIVEDGTSVGGFDVGYEIVEA